jgi:hypothetical protein
MRDVADVPVNPPQQHFFPKNTAPVPRGQLAVAPIHRHKLHRENQKSNQLDSQRRQTCGAIEIQQMKPRRLPGELPPPDRHATHDAEKARQQSHLANRPNHRPEARDQFGVKSEKR